jgi:hypothetical protein
MMVEAQIGGEPASWRIVRSLRRNQVTQFALFPMPGTRSDQSFNFPIQVYSSTGNGRREAWLTYREASHGGGRGVLLMQSSGVGNCINMLSLINGSRFPFLTLVSMRGDFGEANAWQYPMGQATVPVLEAMGVTCLRADNPAEAIATVEAALTMVFRAGRAVAVLFTQKLLGAKRF